MQIEWLWWHIDHLSNRDDWVIRHMLAVRCGLPAIFRLDNGERQAGFCGGGFKPCKVRRVSLAGKLRLLDRIARVCAVALTAKCRKVLQRFARST